MLNNRLSHVKSKSQKPHQCSSAVPVQVFQVPNISVRVKNVLLLLVAVVSSHKYWAWNIKDEDWRFRTGTLGRITGIVCKIDSYTQEDNTTKTRHQNVRERERGDWWEKWTTDNEQHLIERRFLEQVPNTCTFTFNKQWLVVCGAIASKMVTHKRSDVRAIWIHTFQLRHFSCFLSCLLCHSS